MAITKDYLEPTETQQQSETKFIDLVLVGWAKWTRSGAVNLTPVPVGHIWRIPDVLKPNHDLRISDDGFVMVDKTVAVLPVRLHVVVRCEYLESGPQEAKPRKMGLNRLAYRQRLHSAQWTVFTLLQPFVDNWRQKTYNGNA